MPDSTTFSPAAPVGVIAVAPKAAAPKRVRTRSRAKRAGGFFLWVGLVAGGVAALAPIAHFTLQEVETRLLLYADDAAVINALEQDWPDYTSPDYLETLAELGLQMPVVDTGSAYVAAQRAAAIDPSRASVWARLAYLEMERADGKVNQESLDALVKSMDACPLCDQELIAWRFNFVLANWASMPEAVRRRAFEHADLLRWNGPNAEFLADMRAKAKQNGIPFDTYRQAVNTPARTWDIGPAPQARVAKAAKPG